MVVPALSDALSGFTSINYGTTEHTLDARRAGFAQMRLEHVSRLGSADSQKQSFDALFGSRRGWSPIHAAGQDRAVVSFEL
jgi:hypothetical protein